MSRKPGPEGNPRRHRYRGQGRRQAAVVPGNTVLWYRTSATFSPLPTWNVTHPVTEA